MEAILFFPASEVELKLLSDFSKKNNFNSLIIDEDTKKKIAGIELSKLASKNPNAYATDEEIISVVEEVRRERYEKGN